MIFGVTGYYGSGKDEFAKLLNKEGFIHLSLSEEIRKEIKKKKKRSTRKNLIDEGNNIRRKYGPSELADRVIKNIKPGKDYVITSIRNKQEVMRLKERKDFVLINIVAPVELRFDRLVQRGRKGDPITFEEFIQKERLEQMEQRQKEGERIVVTIGARSKKHVKTEAQRITTTDNPFLHSNISVCEDENGNTQIRIEETN